MHAARPGGRAPAASPAPRPETASPSLAFARIARAVRQVIALEAQIAAGHHATQASAARLARDRAQLETLAQTRTATSCAYAAAAPGTPTDDIAVLLARLGQEVAADLERAALPHVLRTHRERPPPPD